MSKVIPLHVISPFSTLWQKLSLTVRSERLHVVMSDSGDLQSLNVRYLRKSTFD